MPLSLATNALTTLATVAGDLGITTPGASDDALIRLINAASGAIEQYVQRRLYREAAIVEKVPGHGSQRLLLSRTPINALTSILRDGLAVDSVVIEDAERGFLRLDQGFLSTARLWGGVIAHEPLPGSEDPAYVVTYDGGWVTPAQEGSPTPVRTLPWDLEQAAIVTCRAWWKARQRDPSIIQERLMSWAATYASDESSPLELPQGVKALLEPYRRLV